MIVFIKQAGKAYIKQQKQLYGVKTILEQEDNNLMTQDPNTHLLTKETDVSKDEIRLGGEPEEIHLDD